MSGAAIDPRTAGAHTPPRRGMSLSWSDPRFRSLFWQVVILGTVAAALDAMGKAGETVVPVLITVDPERDGPAELADYVGLFHPALAGLTGTPEQIARLDANSNITIEEREESRDGRA